MQEIKQAAVIDGEMLTVAIPHAAQAALEEWHARYTDELAAVLAPFGLHPFDIRVPEFRRVLTAEELRAL